MNILFDYSKCQTYNNNDFTCEKYKIVMGGEIHFEEERHIPEPDYNKIEIQIQWLTRYRRWPFNDVEKIQQRKQNII